MAYYRMNFERPLSKDRVERIKETLSIADCTREELAVALGVSRAVVSHCITFMVRVEKTARIGGWAPGDTSPPGWRAVYVLGSGERAPRPMGRPEEDDVSTLCTNTEPVIVQRDALQAAFFGGVKHG